MAGGPFGCLGRHVAGGPFGCRVAGGSRTSGDGCHMAGGSGMIGGAHGWHKVAVPCGWWVVPRGRWVRHDRWAHGWHKVAVPHEVICDNIDSSEFIT